MRFKCRFLKKKFLLLLITLGIGSALYANDELKSLADSLRRMIDEKPLFIQQKEQRINRIKCLLKGSGLTLEQKYKINFQLCNEYKKFVVDSAIHYVDQNLEIARKLNNRDLKNQSSLQLSLLYSMCGRYRDAELILEKIKTSELSKDLLSVYYETYSRFWEYYSITANSRYGKQRAVYQDSLLSLLDQTSFDYKLSRAYYYGGRDSIKAKTVLQELLDTEEVGTPHYAMITHAYASFCWHQKKMDERKKYLMMSAIADIRNATRETASLQALALIQYEEKNLSDAFKFTQSAIDDVVSSGIHFRAMEIYKFYSIINTAYQTEEELMQFVQLYYQRTLPEKLQLTLAFFLFMCFTSMHITDARMFCIEQVNNDVLTYYRVKNRNCKPEPIKIPMPVPAEKLLEEWAEGREEGRLFRNVQCDQVVNRQLKAIAKELGINKKISAKTGRHTFATIYLRKTKDLSSLQKLLGHSNIRETMIYAHVMDESKREGMQCFNSFTL